MRARPILLAGVALALSGCGGDSNSDAKQSTPPTATTNAAPPRIGTPQQTTTTKPEPPRSGTTANDSKPKASLPERTQTKTVRPNLSRERKLRGRSRSNRALEDSGVIP